MEYHLTNSEDFWDKIAAKNDRKVIAPIITPSQTHINTINGIAKNLKANDIVLDFACGSGIKTIDIASNVQAIKAIDTSFKMIEVAKKRAFEKEVYNIDFESINIFDDYFKVESFDVVLALNILHLLEEPDLILKRISKLLRPGGLLISATACLGERWSPLASCLLLLSKTRFVPRFNKYSVSGLEQIIGSNNFSIEETVNISKALSEHLIVAKKMEIT